MSTETQANSAVWCRVWTMKWWMLLSVLVAVSGCERKVETSLTQAKLHVEALATIATADVEEVRTGLPKGAVHLAELYSGGVDPSADLQSTQVALNKARNKEQDLRVAKSTFFALVDLNGKVVRSDHEQDGLAGKDFWAAFTQHKAGVSGQYLESRGELAEAAGVRGRRDGQWVATSGIRVNDKVVGLYATGWSWASYAYRLEFNLRDRVQSEVITKGPPAKMPLLYVYVIVDDQAMGAPVSPDVNAKAILDQKVLEKLSGDGVIAIPLEIEGREFGLAARRVPALGKDVAIAVLRSET
jgi:hypothetical protein